MRPEILVQAIYHLAEMSTVELVVHETGLSESSVHHLYNGLRGAIFNFMSKVDPQTRLTA